MHQTPAWTGVDAFFAKDRPSTVSKDFHGHSMKKSRRRA